MKDKPTWLKNLFPWEQKTIDVNGRLMAYVDEGDADVPPVLLLHGNQTWGFVQRALRMRTLAEAAASM